MYVSIIEWLVLNKPRNKTIKENWIMKTKITFIIVILAAVIMLISAGDARAATWTQKADMPTPRWGHLAAVVNDKIYVIGGIASEPSFMNGTELSAVEEYEPATDTWTRKADMPVARGYLTKSNPVVDGKIYVIGGGKFGSSRVDVYDPAMGTWSRGNDMPTPRVLLATVAWDDKIYAFGGLSTTNVAVNRLQALDVTEVYNPKTDIWTQPAPMPQGVWEHSANVVDGKIYVVGGSYRVNAMQILQVYDPQTDTWTKATPMPLSARGFSASVICGNIYAVGGWLNSGQRPYSDTWVYDYMTDTWTQADPLPDFRAELTTSVINGKIYAIGGTPRQHNCQATSTVYEYELNLEPPPPDFNGDEIIDAADISIMIDYWHTDNPLYDIAPAPCGDGIVDVQDLIVLSEHLFEEVLPDSLVAYWKLDETEGDSAYDSAGGNFGTLSGNPIWQPDSGQVVGALQFDGLDDYISTDKVLNPKFAEFSVFAWIKGGSPGQVIISQKNSFGGVGATWLGIDSVNGCLMTGLVSPPIGRLISQPLESNQIITDDIWHHIGFVWEGSYRTLYVDGVEVATDANPLASLENSDGSLYIGVNKNLDAGTFFSGLIDDVHIYNVALTAEEIVALAQ
jgi:N-acetylneuraminic acid mutarotase